MTPADLAIRGRIATLDGDSGFGWAGSVTITDGIVSGVGARAAARSGGGTRVWRLPDELCVIPGITDAHLHLGMAARAASSLALDDAPDRTAVLARVADAHGRLLATGDERTAIEGHGWSLDQLRGWPTSAELARVAPHRSVALWSHDHHTRWVSRDLAEAAVVIAGDAAPLIRRGPDGEATGILHEAAAALVDPLLPAWSTERRIAALGSYAADLAALGVTGVHDPGELADETGLDGGPALYRRLAREGRLPLRVWSSIREPLLAAALAAGMRTGAGEGRYRDGWLKLFADGALGSRSAALLAPWEADDPAGAPVGDPSGLLTASPDGLLGSARQAVDAGIAVQIHGIGDRAVRVAIDVLADLPRLPGAHHRVEHAQLVDPADIGRFARLGIAASVQPCHLCTDEPAMRVGWGTRTANAFPLASLDATGALIPLGTDAPVESPDPWRNLAAAVTRSDPGWPEDRQPFHAEQALSLERALRAACVDPARTAGHATLGRLVVGAPADLLVVPWEALADPGPRGARLAATRPLATLIDGQPTHLAGGFDPDA
jgi:predicted amidohydrolase YtcJ